MEKENKQNTEALGDRLAIVKQATKLYLEDQESFSIHNLARELEVNPADIYHYYPNKKAILMGYYTLLVDRYQEMVEEIEDFQSYDLAEKLSNFIYSSFEMMMENRSFVEETFEGYVLDTPEDNAFKVKTRKLLKEFMTKDSNISHSNQLIMQDLFYDFLVQQYLQLIKFWLEDSSPEFEKSMAYTDKMTSFLQEVMYTSVLDKGMDLFKFMMSNDQRLSRIPVVGTITRKIFN